MLVCAQHPSSATFLDCHDQLPSSSIPRVAELVVDDRWPELQERASAGEILHGVS